MNNVLPVMHGSPFVQVDTLMACYNTQCSQCAYQLQKVDPSFTICKANCEHKVILYFNGVDNI